MKYKYNFSYFLDTVFPVLASVLGFFVAFGQLDVVVIDTILQGETFSFEFLNYYTGETELTTIYGYTAIGDYISAMIESAQIPAVDKILFTLINVINNVLGWVGHAIYFVLFGSPVSMPCWLGLILFFPRLILLRWALAFVQSVVHYVT